MIDDAIRVIQDHALDCSYGEGQIRYAPDFPVEGSAVLPMSIAHLGGGSADAMNATTVLYLPNVFVDFHFNRSNMATAYRQMDAIIREFPRRLCGDPTLAGVVDTIVFPVTWTEPQAVDFNNLQTIMVRFTVPLKTLEEPI